MAQDQVLDWNEHAVNAIVRVANQPPPRAMIRLAMVQVAVYNAVNAARGFPYEPYGPAPAIARPASVPAAAATAAHDVLIVLFPAQQADLDAKYAASLAPLPDGPAKTNGIAIGREAATALLELRAGDGRDAVIPNPSGSGSLDDGNQWDKELSSGIHPGVECTQCPGAAGRSVAPHTSASGPGVWVPTPPAFAPPQAPEVAYVRPWALNSPSQFRVEPPPALDSPVWIRDYHEVKSLGAATGSSRTPEQTDIARFWTDNPTLQWNRAWRAISISQELSMMENARLFAMLATTASDALIACWDSKYTYSFWRPVTAIRAGETDGSFETEADPNWNSLAPAPPHPEYPSAHGVLSSAITRTLKAFFETDNFDFTIDSTVTGLASPVRHYFSFSQALDEVLDARVYAGIHYRNSTAKGAIMGKQVSRFLTKHFFQPLRPKVANQ
jgi:hypothetical protein